MLCASPGTFKPRQQYTTMLRTYRLASIFARRPHASRGASLSCLAHASSTGGRARDAGHGARRDMISDLVVSLLQCMWALGRAPGEATAPTGNQQESASDILASLWYPVEPCSTLLQRRLRVMWDPYSRALRLDNASFGQLQRDEAGVIFPCMGNILGVILFLRGPWRPGWRLLKMIQRGSSRT